MDSLGDRIKQYEAVTRSYATQNMPLFIRVDGKAFHTLTKDCNKPFDGDLIKAMTAAATRVAEEMQGFKAAYVQSDEVTFMITDYDSTETQGWFKYNISKIISISASMMSVFFNDEYSTDSFPVFDSRVFSVPREDAINVFLWRAQDWERNSLQMYSRSFFSHRSLHQKNRAMMHDMLYDIGKNWATDLSDIEKNGIFILKTDDGIVYDTAQPTYDSIKRILYPLIYPENMTTPNTRGDYNNKAEKV